MRSLAILTIEGDQEVPVQSGWMATLETEATEACSARADGAESDPATISIQLKEIVSKLTDRGSTGDAEAAQRILDSGVITGR